MVASKIIYTLTDEAPLLATFSLLPIVAAFAAKANIDVVKSDVSVAARILGEFPERLTAEQKVPDNLAELGRLTQFADTIIIKLRFVSSLLLVGKVARQELKLATIANRVPEAPATTRAAEILLNGINFGYQSVPSQIYRPLERFLRRLKIPVVATLPDSPSYALSDSRGLGICELGEARSSWDFVRWRPLIEWLDSPASLPHST